MSILLLPIRHETCGRVLKTLEHTGHAARIRDCFSVGDGYRLHRTSGSEVALDLDPAAVSADDTDWKRGSGRWSVKDEAQCVAIAQY